jgi:hypothetical protein
MAAFHLSRVCLVLAATLALVGAAGSVPSYAAQPATAARSVAVSVQGPGFSTVVCDIVKSEGVSSAATQLISSGGGLAGALLGQVVVTAIKNNCPALVRTGIKIVRSILATVNPPQQPAYSPLPTYLDVFTAQRVNDIASALGTNGTFIRNTRDAVCNAVAAGDNAAAVINRSLGNARLRHLTAMNAFIRLIVDTCARITKADANYITGAVTNIIFANEYQNDLDPPVVQIYRTSGQRNGAGAALVSAWFRWFDRGGVKSCDVELGYAGAWHSVAGGCSLQSVWLLEGTNYAWAYRATDYAGHVSQWAVTTTGTA